MKPRNRCSPPCSRPRRDALRLIAGAGAGLAMPSIAAGASSGPIERSIPASGERLPAVGLGTWQSFDIGAGGAQRAAAREVLRRFAQAGGRVIDSSPMYGSSEQVIGELSEELGLDERLFLATKVWTSGRDAGIAQMEESFRRMHTKRMDLMQVHNLLDAATHLKTLREWKRSGRVRYIGLTHYHSGAYADIERSLEREKPDFMQINYSLGEREAERRLLPLAAERGIAVLINRPFGKGALLAAVRGRPVPEWAREIDAASWPQVLLKWILGHPAVTCVIPATRNPQHLLENMAAATGRLPDAGMRKRMAQYFAAL